eukprot:g3108.t1
MRRIVHLSTLLRRTQNVSLHTTAVRCFAAEPSKAEVMKMLKELREATGAPVKDCKDAVNTSIAEGIFEQSAIFEKAVELLRIRGVATAAKKSGRAANEGLVAVSTKDNMGVLVEVTSETDFTARNESFQRGVGKIAHAALAFSQNQPVGPLDIDKLLKAPVAGGGTVEDTVLALVTAIRENIKLKRAQS